MPKDDYVGDYYQAVGTGSGELVDSKWVVQQCETYLYISFHLCRVIIVCI